MGEVIMSEDKEKWTRRVAKLIKLTREGQLKWQRSATPEHLKLPTTVILDGPVYTSQHKDQNLRIYKTKVLTDVVDNPFALGDLFRPKNKAWVEAVSLDITDDHGLTLLHFPQVSALKDLYSAVIYQVTNVQEFLDELLTEG